MPKLKPSCRNFKHRKPPFRIQLFQWSSVDDDNVVDDDDTMVLRKNENKKERKKHKYKFRLRAHRIQWTFIILIFSNARKINIS